MTSMSTTTLDRLPSVAYAFYIHQRGSSRPRVSRNIQVVLNRHQMELLP